MKPAIRVEGLTRSYTRYAARRHFATFKSALLGGSLFRDLRPEASFPAIDQVSFTVAPGQTVAVVGPNGSGKSTLLKVLAGILKPTRGTVEVNGRVAALLELGAGFHPEVSGRDNVITNGIMLGLSRREIERRLPEIVRFAELEDFIDAPVKTYSSGMYVRLGFSVAVAVEPDVLLVDEVLAVGDEAFSHKCIDRFRDLRRRGRTVLLVTHALDLVETLADSAILIENGRVTAEGLPREVVSRYRGHVEAKETGDAAALSQAQPAAGPEPPPTAPPDGGPPPAPAEPPSEPGDATPALPDSWRARRWGNQAVELSQVRLVGRDGEPRGLFHNGEPLIIEMEVQVREPQDDFVFGIAIYTREGHLAYGTNTDIDGFRPERLDGPGRVRVRLPALSLLEGSYALAVAVHRRDGLDFDYRHACLSFSVRAARKDVGVARLEHEWEFAGQVALRRPPAPDERES